MLHNNGTVRLNTDIYSYLETSGSQSSHLYLNVDHFFNASVNQTSVGAYGICFPAFVSNMCCSILSLSLTQRQNKLECLQPASFFQPRLKFASKDNHLGPVRCSTRVGYDITLKYQTRGLYHKSLLNHKLKNMDKLYSKLVYFVIISHILWLRQTHQLTVEYESIMFYSTGANPTKPFTVVIY